MKKMTELNGSGPSVSDALTVRTVLERLHAHALAYQRHKEAEGTLSDAEEVKLDEEIETGRILIELLSETGVDQTLGQRAKNWFDAQQESLTYKSDYLDQYHAAFMSGA